MLSQPLAQWAFTVVFCILGAYAILRMVADRRRPLQVLGHLLHLVMALGMVAMAWPWWQHVSVPAQLAVFGAATVWFAVLAGLQVTGRVSAERVGGHGPWHQAAHAVMMAAMVWMVAVMTAGPAAPAAGGHGHGNISAVGVLTGTAATAALLVTAVLLLVDATSYLRHGERGLSGRGGEAVAGSAMSAAMASMCWQMLAD